MNTFLNIVNNKTMKKQIILFTFLILCSCGLQSQELREDDQYQYVYAGKPVRTCENIGDNNNGDLSRGAHIAITTLYFKIKKPNAGLKLYLSLSQICIEKRCFKYNKIQLVFEDGSTGVVSYDSKKYANNGKSEIFEFDVTPYQDLIENSNLKSIVFIDFDDKNWFPATDKYALRRQYESLMIWSNDN